MRNSLMYKMSYYNYASLFPAGKRRTAFGGVNCRRRAQS